MWSNRAVALATILAILPAGGMVVALDDDDKPGIDGEGSIRAWLVLAPIALEDGQDGAQGLEKEQIQDEATLKPRVDNTVEVAGKELTWKVADAEQGILDFNKFVGKETEQSVAYAVSYLEAEKDLANVILKIGSDDEIRVYLNGKRVHSYDEGREFEKDEDTVDGLSLKKGRNVLVLKVVNEGQDWMGSVRVLDMDGVPIKGLQAMTRPD